MDDKQFLRWMYNRLKNVHQENPNVDYMFRLNSMAKATEESKRTPVE